MNSVEKETTERPAGLRSDEIAKPLNAVEITLPDSGIKAVMRKPMLSDLLASQKDQTVDHETASEPLIAMISLITTFNGKARNWHDLATELSMQDYEKLSVEYAKLLKRGK